MQHQKYNRLSKESSPYLLQHANNPVDWYPWGAEALKKAKAEDKPIILSIGYSACHWCHVMERESFENEAIAEIMNQHFVCIKVDREERPDVDQVYMDAVHAMGAHGGWPLNVFLTPDQKPFYGGTYFPPKGWEQLLQNVQVAFRDKRDEIDNSADKFTDTISLSESERMNLSGENAEFDILQLDDAYQQFSGQFDLERGGVKKSPKFPMPNNWLFVLRYWFLTKNHYALQHLKLTLKEMAYGGIYDQIGGGFARYSVDDRWFAPHFEKMLYDNGQLVSLYSEAFMATKDSLCRQVVYETIDWLEREMISEEGGFYAALDADSEGVEGRFYTWTQDELVDLCGDEAPVISAYYNTTAAGNWEDGRNLLHRIKSDEELAKQFKLTVNELDDIIEKFKNEALEKRNERIAPGLDDKILTGWNGIMLRGLIDAYRAFGESKFLTLALNNANFISDKLMDGDKLFRSYKNGEAKIDAYLDDYAAIIDAFSALYQVTFDEAWLNKADQLLKYCHAHFYDKDEQLFFYTDDSSEKLVARKKELFDNVIPASNSVMANNFFVVGKLLANDDYINHSISMVSKVAKVLTRQVSYLSNWAILMSHFMKPFNEVVISGDQAFDYLKGINENYQPNKVVVGTTSKSNLSLLKNRDAKPDKTLVYVCMNKTCKLPVGSVGEALKLME
ncbi:MAG: thioredoxin domain-containing protein [Cyclobacteriaceae bacterium]